MNLTLTVSWSLEHDTLQTALKNSPDNFLKNSFDIENALGEEEKIMMQSYCLIAREYKFTYDTYNFSIPCEIIEGGTDAIMDYGVTHLVDTIYYTEYNCEFWGCLKESSTPLFLFSEKAMDYWRGKFILLVVISFVIFTLTLLISKNRPITVFMTGIFILLSALPFRRLDWVLTFIPSEISGIFSVFFTKAHNVFIIMLIIGLVFIGVGLAFKFFGLSMRLRKGSSEEGDEEKISKSDVRKIVDEEISKKDVVKSKKKK
jgi:hypothetical protein